MYLNLVNWKTEKGWCIDANGREDGRGNNQGGFTKEQCFALCENSSDFNGCTFYVSGICITYSGDIVGGSGDLSGAYQCFYRKGTPINFREIKHFFFYTNYLFKSFKYL